MRFRYIVSLLLFLGIISVNAQTDTEFWFGAPDVSAVHGNNPWNGAPIYLHMTAVYATHVTISRPADPAFTPLEYDLLPLEHQTVRLDDILTIDEIETYPLPNLVTGIQDKGFKIVSDPGEITVYYELDQYWNRDIFPLKGMNALGTDFWVSTQNYWDNGDYSGTAWSGFVITATENNTIVTVYQNADWLNFNGPAVRTLYMDEGETFAFRAQDVDALEHINGVHVTSDKAIAITYYDDSMAKEGGCRDIHGDQIVPTALIGQEYIVMKGYLDVNERIFITGTEPATDIYVDDVLQTTITAGQVYSYEITNNSTVVYGSKPIYLTHITGFGCEVGGAVLPTIDGCTGSNSVTFTRTPNALDAFYVNIMVRNDTVSGSPTENQSIYNFRLESGGTVYTIPDTYFEFIHNDAFAVLKNDPVVHAFFASNISPGDEAQVSNDIARFHLGVINGGASTGCKYGYFSDYAANTASAGLGGALAVTQDVYCNLDPIRLVASGGNAYSWRCISDPEVTDLISDTSLAAPFFYPDTTGDFIFEVKVFGECSNDTVIPMLTRVYIGPTSDFTLDENEGCSPFTVTLNNTTNQLYADEMVWVFNNPYEEINQDTMPLSFDHTMPSNLSDTIRQYRVSLYSWAPYHSCESVREKWIKVKPELNAAFDLDEDQGCHPLAVNFTNLSTGHLDSTSYFWEFGDNSQSFAINPSHSFDNYSLDDTTFTVQLKTESPFGCLDSTTRTVTVHPRVRAVMAVNTSASCSPLNIYIDPSNSVGVDTFFWHIGYPPGLDSTYATTEHDSILLFHQDLTYASPDTIYVNLIGMNRMGCTDTFPERNIVVFPEVNALFEINRDSICDADSITFVNSSTGFDLFYNWDFDDGAVSQDTLGSDFTHAFFNRSDADSAYRVNLTAISGYFCESSFDTVIIVHPYIRANFALDYENNCTPILTQISNLSVRGHSFEWDLGDGTTSTTTDPTFTHQYWNPSADSDTTYVISLVALNNEGCSDTLLRELDIFPHVIAEFDMSDSIGCSPLNVGFTNLSSGGLLSYLWDFGNGISSTNPSPPNRIYTNYSPNDTSYIVSLTAINPYGCDSSITDTLQVFSFIDADFNLAQSDSCSPFVLRAENLSSAGANFFTWDLINSGLPTDNNPIPDFGILTNTGLETDTLYLRLIASGANDPEHLACADRDSIRVLLYPELDVDFSLDVAEGCQPLLAQITNETNIIPGSNFQWFVDSTYYSALAQPDSVLLYNYEDVDVSHEIRLDGVSRFNCRGEHTETVTVYSYVDAQFSVNKSGICSADSFIIDRRTSRGGIDTYEWNFAGDVDNRSDEVFSYSFENPASSTPLSMPITLTVYNSHLCSDNISRNVLVYPEVRAAFSVDDSTVCYPYESIFTNSSENAGFYLWNFGDGTGSNDSLPGIYIFNNFDKYTDTTYLISLIARSPYNCYDTVRHQITVYAKPEAEFYFSNKVGCPPLLVETNNNSEGLNPTWFWDFGDGNTSTAFEPTHPFENETSNVLERTVSLMITSSRGCTDTTEHSLSVYPGVQVSFTASTYEGCSPLTVDFTGSAPNTNNILWLIDGVPFSELADPSRQFVNTSAGYQTYDVSFEGESLYGCSDDTTQTITVYSTPVAEFIPTPLNQFYNTAEDQTLVTFNNETNFRTDWDYEWNFGDGNSSSSNASAVEHYYGEYFWGPNSEGNQVPVSLLAWNPDRTECEDLVTYNITIKPPLPEIDLEENVAACVPFTVDFAATVKYADDDSYRWDFGEAGATSADPEPQHTYREPGTYTVMLVVEGDGGSNWDSRIITVYPKPNIDFTFNDSAVFVRSQNRPDEIVNFYNQTTLGQNYWWFFELPDDDINAVAGYMDLASANSTDPQPTWYWNETGTYYVGLIAESPHTCLDTLIHPVPIIVLGEGNIQFPNAFFVNPAGSAPSDYVDDPESPRRNLFRAYGQGVEEFKFEVYNRWGVLVFETDDINIGWNGFIDGKPAKQDVYVWRARGRYTNGEPFQASGDVTLIHSVDPTQLND